MSGGEDRPDHVSKERALELLDGAEWGVLVVGSTEFEPVPHIGDVDEHRVKATAETEAVRFGEFLDDDVATDGGREFSAQPAVCPECRLTLDENGKCRTNGCPGPDE